jgi:Carboxypeptidase regulatory-like domain/TonB-dependent Receptor Plug Domain/TonB dependent receptor
MEINVFRLLDCELICGAQKEVTMKCPSKLHTVAASVFALVLIHSVAVHVNVQAQVAGGSITGTVVDTSGGVVANVSVSITNVATGINRSVTTNEDGIYIAPNLLPASYELKFTAPGFRTEVRTGIGLTVGATVTLNMTMRVGTTKETIEVQSEVPDVQLTTSDISAVVNANTVRELPLNGRSWTDLATLQPGVNRIQTQPDFSAGTDRGNRGFGQQLTISGARPQQNNYRLDGVSLNDYANGAPGSVLGGSLGVDAIQEFSVLTSNYSAEYGKTSGGVVNAITRSGTNQFHGSGYEFLRNSALDTRNYFDVGGVPPFKRNQFGGAVGGPIFKNRTFFFADYEGIRQSKGISVLTTVPSQAAWNGTLCSIPQPQPNPCNTTQITVDPNAAKFSTFYPLPKPQEVFGNGDQGSYTFAAQQIVSENFFTTRVDHRFSDKDSLAGSYMFDKTPYASPDGLNNVEFSTLTSRQFVSIEETHIFSPSFANSFRIGGNHEAVNNNLSLKAINPDAAKTDFGVGGTAFAGRAAPQVLISGITDFTGGIGGSPTYFYHWNSAQLYDDAFITKRTHSIRFGIAVERMFLNVLADTDPNGIWKFGSLSEFDPNTGVFVRSTFLQNLPKKFQGGIANTLSPRNLRQTLFGTYLQDDWRVRPNLTVNLGLRYEMSTVPTETNGKIANLRNLSDPLPVCGRVVPGECSGAGPFFNNPTLHNFEPRVGFAWDPLSNGKTAIRGGIGLFDVQPLPYQFVLLTTQAAPYFSYTAINSPGQGNFPNFKGINQQFPANTLRSTYVQRPKRDYVMQWNLNLQQQLTPTLAAMVAYVGSRGVHQPFRVDEANLVIPTKGPNGYLWPKVDVFGNIYSPVCNATDPNGPPDTDPSCLPPNPINPAFGSVRGMFYESHSYYNALEAQLAKRMSHGFQAQGTFTWAKSMDTSSASVAGDTFGNSISSLSWFDLRLSRGLSDFNVGRTLVVNGTWEAPTPKSLSAPAQWALGGWELGVIFTASDGIPFTPSWGTGSDPQNTLSSDDWAFPNRLGGSGCKTLTTGHPGAYIKTNCFAVPTAPSQAFWNANCDPAPPSLGGPLAPGDLRCFNLRGNAGRNILIGPGVTSLDFSVFKNNYIKKVSEKFNVQFRAEIFNILNHSNFAPPSTPTNTDIFDGTGALNSVAGQVARTTTTSREIQFAVKVVF